MNVQIRENPLWKKINFPRFFPITSHNEKHEHEILVFFQHLLKDDFPYRYYIFLLFHKCLVFELL